MPSLADVDTVMQSLSPTGGGQAAGTPQYGSYPMVQPHPAPDNSGAMTNLSDEDYAKLMAGKQAPAPAAAPAQSPLDAAMPPQYSSPDLAAKMDIAKQPVAGPLPMPANPEFPTAGKKTGLVANIGAGTSEAVAQTLGLPVDLTTALINAGAKAVGLPTIQEPVGGSGTFEKLFGLIGANPQEVAPADQGERLARAAAAGATSVALPGGIASKLVRAGMTAPALASLAGGAGVGGAAAGAAGGVGSEVAQEVVPEPLKPLAGMIGGLVTAAPVAFGTAAATAGARAAADAAKRALTPGARIPEIVGKTVTEAAGGVPAATPAPIPSVPLNLAQTTASPAVASALDTLNAQNVPAMQAERSAQNTAMVNAVSGGTPGEPALHAPAAVQGATVPEVIAGRGSTAATGGIQQAAKIIASEEGRVWNKPSLTEPRVSSETGKRLVEAEVRTLRREQPGLALALDESAALQRTVRELELMPEKAAANQLNAISSRFRRIARDPGEAADVRLVATRLANAAQEGIWQAPEVAGRAPATQAELEAATAQQPPAAPTRPAWAGGAPIGGRPRRPQTFLDAVVQAGGVQPDSDLRAMNADLYHHRQGGRLLNPKGMSPNRLREFAVQEGFLPQGETDEHAAKELIRSGLNGVDAYRPEDLADVDYWRQIDEHQQRETYQRDTNMTQVRDVAEAAGVKLTPAMEEHAAELMLRDPKMHPEEAARQAAAAGEAAALQANAQRLAFGAPGVEPGARTEPMPDLKTLREGVAPDPELVRDLKAARAFTRREAETLGHASFDNILRRNSRGNETVIPGTAMSRFFDFTNGVERPGDIKNVSRFLDDIRSEWLKLSAEERGRTFDPETIGSVKQQLEDGARNYIFGKMLDAISSKEMDVSGNRMIQYRQAVDWLNTNRDMLERSGLFTPDQMDLLDRFKQTAQIIQRGKDIGRAEGSPTFTRAMHPVRFVDLFTGPMTGRILGGAAGAVLGNLLTNWLGEAAIGAMIGAEMGGAGRGAGLMQALYAKPREQLLRSLDEAFRNPQIAHDLAMRVGTAGTARPSATTQAWVRSLLATQPAQAAGEMVQ